MALHTVRAVRIQAEYATVPDTTNVQIYKTHVEHIDLLVIDQNIVILSHLKTWNVCCCSVMPTWSVESLIEGILNKL